MAFIDFQNGFARMVKAFRQVSDGGANLIVESQLAVENQDDLTPEQQRVVGAAYSGIEVSLAAWPTFILDGARGSWLEFAAEQINRPFESDGQLADDIVRFMNDNGDFVAGLVVTYGADPADTLVGIHRRLNINKYGHRIETGSHNIPGGVTIRVTQTEANGGEQGVTTVNYESESTRGANSLRVKGAGTTTGIVGVGPINPGLATNALLSGNSDVGDNAAITDGDADTGGISSWDQTRTGVPTVTVDTTNKWKEQDYGVAIGGASVGLEITQPIEDWDLEDAVPVAYDVLVFQNGAGLDVAITASLGLQSRSFTEADLTNGAWTHLLPLFDENLWPENFDTVDSEFSLDVQLQGPSTGEAILGGVFAVLGFQLQVGGEWHFYWEKEVTPALFAEVSFGADSQTRAGEIQEAWVKMFLNGPSLPLSGSSLWALP